MKKIYKSATELIGGTPLLEVTKIEEKLSLNATILAKLEAYEKGQEIKVGDVVTIFPRSGGQYNAIVVYVKSEKYIDAIYSDGITTNNVPPKLYKKTGKHIDISSILEQIKE